VIPALSMAQRDRRQDDLDDSAADFIWQVARELVDELNEEHSDPEGASRDEIQKASFDTRSVAGSANVVCIPARTAGDETVGTMLVHLLEQNGIPAHCVSLASSLEMIDQLAADRPDIVVISSLQPFGVTHARKLYALIKARLPGTPILLGVWNFSGELGGVIARLGDDMRSLIVTDLAGAAESLRALAKEHLSANHSEAIALR